MHLTLTEIFFPGALQVHKPVKIWYKVCVCVCGSLTSPLSRAAAAEDLKYVLCYFELYTGEPQNTEPGTHARITYCTDFSL